MRLKVICLSFLYVCLIPQLICGQDNRWQKGGGAFRFWPAGFPNEKSIAVHYYIPAAGDIRQMRVLFAFHGAERSAAFTLHMWRYFAEKDKFIVIVPEFSRSGYPENEYQLGAVFRTKGFKTLNPPDRWTYAVVEELFDRFKEETGNRSTKYDIWGHSAGGQFVHRFLLAVPDARVRLAVASNPGFWTFPLIGGIKDGAGKTYGWPYSVKGSPFSNHETIRRFLAQPLIVHLGDADLDSSGKYVPTTPAAFLQGKNRFERGLKFYRESESLAGRMGVPFHWRLVVVKGTGHSGHGMVYGKVTINKGIQLYSTERTDSAAAYGLIYGPEYKAEAVP